MTLSRVPFTEVFVRLEWSSESLQKSKQEGEENRLTLLHG